MLSARTLVLLAVVLAPSAHAQISEKEAVKQVQASAQAQLKAFKATAHAALAVLDADLATIEASLADDSDPAVIAAQVGGIAAGVAAGVTEAAESALGFVHAAAGLALEDLADGTDLQGLYPEALYSGEGNLLEDFRRDLFKAVGKTQTSALKRLAQTAKRAEKDAGIALHAVVRIPGGVSDLAANQNAVALVSLGPTLDVAVSASSLDTADDGVIALGGRTDLDSEDVSVFVTGMEFDLATATPGAGTGRFVVILDQSGAGLSEGNYVAGVSQSGGPTSASAGIGVR